MTRPSGASRFAGLDWEFLRLSALGVAAFSGIGIFLPYFPVWLESRGLSEERIALILAAPMIVRVVAGPVLTALADRRGDLSGMMAWCALIGGTGYLILGFLHDFWSILICILLLSIAQAPIYPLTDAITMIAVKRRAEEGGPRLDYGRIRAFGSFSVLAGMLASGTIIGAIPIAGVVWVLVLSDYLTAAVAAFLPKTRPVEERHIPILPNPIARPVLLAAFIVGIALVQASHGMVYGFATLHWKSLGFGASYIGFAWAVGVAAEILLFVLAGKFARGTSAPLFLMLGGGGALIRWVLMALTVDPWMIVGLQAMHAFSFGATHLGGIYLLNAMVDDTRRAQAQGWLQSANAVCLAGSMALTGVFYARFGGGAYFAMAGMAAAGFLLVCGALVMRGQPHKSGVGG